jgi:hypothetical protein
MSDDQGQVCIFCGASAERVGLMHDEDVWRCINEYNCVEREEAQHAQ